MIHVLFFGKFSDLIDNTQGLKIEHASVGTVEDIISRIAAINEELYREITAPQVMIAVNQEIVTRNSAVSDGDEVAFLPPVTGG